MRDQNLNQTDKFKAKKSLGQNFLTSNVVPGWMCQAADLKSQDQVLEIGPGTGALTEVLLKNGTKVTAIEADSRAISLLREKFSIALDSQQLTLIEADIKGINPKDLGLKEHNYKLIANIPYYLSGWLLRHYLSGPCQPSTLVFLLQKELVERITRDPKSSLLSLSVKAFGVPRYVKTVKRGHFNPSPKVDSAILAIADINRDHFKQLDADDFFTLLHLGLGQRRKQLLGNLAAAFKRTDLEKIFEQINLKLDIRGEDLDLADWLRLAQALYPQK